MRAYCTVASRSRLVGRHQIGEHQLPPTSTPSRAQATGADSNAASPSASAVPPRMRLRWRMGNGHVGFCMALLFPGCFFCQSHDGRCGGQTLCAGRFARTAPAQGGGDGRFLGFASGLPFLLTANTFGYWLRDDGTSLAAIGFISWVGFACAFKVYWSPWLTGSTCRCSGAWDVGGAGCCYCQLLVAVGLLGMALVGTAGGLAAIGAFALLTAFASARRILP